MPAFSADRGSRGSISDHCLGRQTLLETGPMNTIHHRDYQVGTRARMKWRMILTRPQWNWYRLLKAWNDAAAAGTPTYCSGWLTQGKRHTNRAGEVSPTERTRSLSSRSAFGKSRSISHWSSSRPRKTFDPSSMRRDSITSRFRSFMRNWQKAYRDFTDNGNHFTNQTSLSTAPQIEVMTTASTSYRGHPSPLLPILTTTTAPIWHWEQQPLEQPILGVLMLLALGSML